MANDYFLAIGLMSGTSMDGIDCALIETNGQSVNPIGKTGHLGYSPEIREEISEAMQRAALLGHPGKQDSFLDHLADKLTVLHADIVHQTLHESELLSKDVKVIGFHGQTLLHKPQEGWTWQIGNGQLLANVTHIPVVDDFRSNDMKKGGQGAPLVPIYHQALIKEQALKDYPTAILNIGGVSNITWIGSGQEGRMLAFDTGPGNALLDDWINRHTGNPMDLDGAIAAQGIVDQDLLTLWMENSYFYKMPPKSLDRGAFEVPGLDQLSLEDGAATLVAFTVKAIEIGLRHCPDAPNSLYITGGGRHNKTLMASLRELHIPVFQVEDLGWRGDFLEAEAFAYLAGRHLLDLPISFPGTTGISHSSPGGILHIPEKNCSE